jgi:hypothetical protein
MPLQNVTRVTACRFDPALGSIEVSAGGEVIMRTQQPDGDCAPPHGLPRQRVQLLLSRRHFFFSK